MVIIRCMPLHDPVIQNDLMRSSLLTVAVQVTVRSPETCRLKVQFSVGTDALGVWLKIHTCPAKWVYTGIVMR